MLMMTLYVVRPGGCSKKYIKYTKWTAAFTGLATQAMIIRCHFWNHHSQLPAPKG